MPLIFFRFRFQTYGTYTYPVEKVQTSRGSIKRFLLALFLSLTESRDSLFFEKPKIHPRRGRTTADDDASSTPPRRRIHSHQCHHNPPLGKNAIPCSGSCVKRLRPDLDIPLRDVWTKPFLLGGAGAAALTAKASNIVVHRS